MPSSFTFIACFAALKGAFFAFARTAEVALVYKMVPDLAATKQKSQSTARNNHINVHTHIGKNSLSNKERAKHMVIERLKKLFASQVQNRALDESSARVEHQHRHCAKLLLDGRKRLVHLRLVGCVTRDVNEMSAGLFELCTRLLHALLSASDKRHLVAILRETNCDASSLLATKEKNKP